MNVLGILAQSTKISELGPGFSKTQKPNSVCNGLDLSLVITHEWLFDHNSSNFIYKMMFLSSLLVD